MLQIALLGNPNVGKTTLFNTLTGLQQKVANWPGTTVEYATGVVDTSEGALSLTDLPGLYGLSPAAEDERVARRFLASQVPDVTVIVVDASNLERNLFLVVDALEVLPRVVVALNKIDLAAEAGLDISAEVLSRSLGVPVVPIAATRRDSLDPLLQQVRRAAAAPAASPIQPPYGEDVLQAVQTVAAHFTAAPGALTREQAALRLLQGDHAVLDTYRLADTPAGGNGCCDASVSRLVVEHAASPREVAEHVNGLASRQPELELAMADAKFTLVREIADAAVQRRPVATGRGWTEWLDAVLLHPVGGYAALAAIFAAVFWLAFAASAPLSSLVEDLVGTTGEVAALGLAELGAPAWLHSLFVDGIVAGIGAVLAFVPYMALFFTATALLETSGYMARASLLADRFMQAVGLHGRGLFPLVSAFGCNVPALTATRALEHRRDRFVLALVIPFVPCNARLGVMAIMAGAFFGVGGGLVLLGLVGISVVVVAAVSWAYRRTALPGEPSSLLLELPPYARPRVRDVLLPAATRVLEFVSRIWRFLLPATVVVWALTYFPIGAEPDHTLAAQLGQILAPLGSPFGFDWRLMVAILFGFVAKETTLNILAVLYGLTSDGPLSEVLAASITPLTGFAFLLVYMLYVPCLATVVQMRRELGSNGWAFAGVLVMLGVAFGLGLVVYRLGLLLGAG